MAPVVHKLERTDWAEPILINTGQHKAIVDVMMAHFGLTHHIDLSIMVPKQSLGTLAANLSQHLDGVLSEQHYDCVLAVGDTSTALFAGLIAFYHKIPFGHIEAGLRSLDRMHPFPEEAHRVLADHLATWHFAPTHQEYENLVHEGIAKDGILISGNTVIDALKWTLLRTQCPNAFSKYGRYILVTTHRRENFGEGLANICDALVALADEYTEYQFVFPVHPNPNVREPVYKTLNTHSNIHLIEPLGYADFAHLLARAHLVMTDSGGVQEEAPALGVPVVVMRKVTERAAILSEEVGVLAGTTTSSIVDAVRTIMNNPSIYSRLARGVSPYGDGTAAPKIIDFLSERLLQG